MQTVVGNKPPELWNDTLQRRKLGEHYHEELKRLSKKLLTAKRNAQEKFFSSVLKNEAKS
jgi:hypothetical protein